LTPGALASDTVTGVSLALRWGRAWWGLFSAAAELAVEAEVGGREEAGLGFIGAGRRSILGLPVGVWAFAVGGAAVGVGSTVGVE